MRFLKASVLMLSLILVACEGAVSPTEPELIQSEQARAPEEDASDETRHDEDQHDEDEPE